VADDDREFEPGDHFHLGGRDAEYLEVWVVSRSDAADYWDGNWVTCDVRLSAGGFRGRFSANFRTNELEVFADEVRTLQHDLKSTARFDTMEEQLRLVLEGDGRGHIACTGEARDEAGTGNILKFELNVDQTQLFGTMTQLDELVSRYPVRGSPAV
jgi:hypothetical protein